MKLVIEYHEDEVAITECVNYDSPEAFFAHFEEKVNEYLTANKTLVQFRNKYPYVSPEFELAGVRFNANHFITNLEFDHSLQVETIEEWFDRRISENYHG